MKNIKIVIAAAFVFLATFVACKKADQIGNTSLSQPHQAKIFLTDHQTPLFDSVFIDIQKLEIKVSDDGSEVENETGDDNGNGNGNGNDDGNGDGNDNGNNNGNGNGDDHGHWVAVDIRPGIYNILRFRNGLDTILGNGTLPNANIRKLRLTLGAQNSVMVDGQSFSLNVHGNDGVVVINMDDSNFEVTGSDQLLFWIDFDAAGSIRTNNSGSGNNNEFELKPHIKAFTKNKSGRIEGRVFPKEGNALVMAINGTDTTMAIPDDDDGEFKIVGLNAGTYTLFVDGQNGYTDTTIHNVNVVKGEDTHLPVITLHQ